MAKVASKKKAPTLSVGAFPVADLTPPKRKRALENAALQTKLIKVVGCTAVFAVLVSGAAFGFKLYSSSQYSAAQAESTSINTKIEAQAVIDNLVTVYDSRKGAIASASAADINWEQAYKSLEDGSTSVGATITSFQIQTGGTAKDSASTAALVNIESSAPISYASAYTAYSELKGIVSGQVAISSLGSSKANDQRVYTYSVAVLLDNSFLKNKDASVSAQPTEAPSSDASVSETSPFTELNDGDVTVKDLQNLRQDVADQNAKQNGGN